MTKLRNKIVLVLLALCFAVCAGLFVACGGDDPKDNSVTYTVTVTAGDAAAEGVQVTVKKGSATLGTPKTTGSDGKVEFKLAKDSGYTVTLADLPRGYKVADGAELKFDSNRKLTVALEEKPVSYTVKLVNPDNTAYTAAGVLVGICTVEGNNCLELVEPDATGTVKIYDAAKTNYHIQVKNLPAGYAIESDGTYALKQNADGHYVESNGSELVPVYVELTDTVVEQKLTVYPVNVIKLTDDAKLSDEELEGDYPYVEGMAAYKMNIEVEANTTVYYEYTADYSGAYNFYSDNYELVCKLNESFLLGDSYLGGNGIFNPPITMEKGKTYYLNVTNNGEEKATAEAILATPYATNSTIAGAGTVKAEVNKQGKNAIIELEPTAGSTYKLTVNDNGAVKQATSSYMAEYVEFEDADYTNCKELIVKYTEEMQGSLYFAVSIKGNVPAAVDVKIEKIGTHTNTTTVVTTAALTKTADNDDFNKELAPVALNATVVKGDDGKYHLGDKTGPIVYVNLMGTIGVSRYPYNAQPLVYMELATNSQYAYYFFDATTQDDVANPDKGKTFKDFRTVLRGFEVFNFGTAGMTIPADLAENYYADNTNGDGVYPLDDILKEYLELVAEQLDTEWLFACYYYADYAEPDAIVGEYETEDRQYILTIEKFGDVTLKENGEPSYTAFGSWTKSGDDYTFTCVDSWGDECQLTYADGIFTYADFMVELTFVAPADPIVGIYSDVNGDSLYINGDGTCAWGADVGSWNKNADDNNYTITLYVYFEEGGDPTIYKYTAVYSESLDIVMLYTWEGETAPDVTNPDLNADYEFAAVNNNDDEVDITGEYEYTNRFGTTTLTVYEDNSFVMDIYEFDYGNWTDLGDGTFEFTIYYEDESYEVFDVEYNSVNGMLTFYAKPEDPEEEEVVEPTYEFSPVEEEEGEPDMTLISTNQGAVLKLYFDEGSDSTGTFKYYSRKSIEVKLCEGTFTMGPTGLTAVVTKKDREVEEAYANTNEQGQIVVSIKMVGIEGMAEQTFDLPSDEEEPNTQD